MNQIMHLTAVTAKKVFANNLAAINDVNSHCYSIKLKDSVIELIRKFEL